MYRSILQIHQALYLDSGGVAQAWKVYKVSSSRLLAPILHFLPTFVQSLVLYHISDYERSGPFIHLKDHVYNDHELIGDTDKRSIKSIQGFFSCIWCSAVQVWCRRDRASSAIRKLQPTCEFTVWKYVDSPSSPLIVDSICLQNLQQLASTSKVCSILAVLFMCDVQRLSLTAFFRERAGVLRKSWQYMPKSVHLLSQLWERWHMLSPGPTTQQQRTPEK